MWICDKYMDSKILLFHNIKNTVPGHWAFYLACIYMVFIIFHIIHIIHYMVIPKHWRCWWVSLSYFTTTDFRHYKANRNHQQSDQLHISLSCFNQGILSKLFSSLFHYAFSNNIGLFVLQCNSGLLMNKSKLKPTWAWLLGLACFVSHCNNT